jgi:hypothetical protein
VTRLWPDGIPVLVRGEGATPLHFLWQGMAYEVAKVCNRWRIHTRWWEPDRAVWREYVKLLTGDGTLCLLYQDQIDGGWFLVRVYD